ncbi:carbohydrate ABC transporter permease [Seonamhaeicola sp.]|uniref:carbohydrate ABC transporter permease n=1 Tax=Seonamhaeicola sp. TaxID=1912245 RepID=UPI0026349AA6|nr:carbohydrate ABC transporter permease [Seonamhaeicola sp.]
MKALRLQKILFLAVLGVMTLIYIGPFLFSLSISFNADKNVFDWPIKLLPENFTLDNYKNVWKDLPFGKWLFNSVLVTTIQTFSNVFFSALAGFTFARLEFPGRKIIFTLLLSSLMIPGIILLVPKFIVLNELSMINSYGGLILPGLVGVTNIFLMKQFFETIPKDLEQAALIDGCSYFRLFWQIFLPISKPALAAVAIYTFQGAWNEFLWPVIVSYTEDMYTLPLGMASLRHELLTDWPLLMAGTILISLPTLAIFIIFQRYFVQGVASSGLKG